MQKSTKEAVLTPTEWMEKEYPHGVELVYVDYRDSYDENIEGLANMLRDGWSDTTDDWRIEASDECISDAQRRYESEVLNDEGISYGELLEIQDWLQDHDTSTPEIDLLKHTRAQLFYIETPDTHEPQNEKDEKALLKKYGKTPEQKKEIDYVLRNAFYNAPASFYFYAEPLDVYKALHESTSKYIQVAGAYFGTVDRAQGSNWLGEDNCFNLTIPRDCFLANVYLDGEKGTGYGWGTIAGRCSYDEAGIASTDTKRNGFLLVEGTTSEAQLREKRLAKHWDDTKTCTAGDMNMSRHIGPTPYNNDYPCGNRCEACGTFWID